MLRTRKISSRALGVLAAGCVGGCLFGAAFGALASVFQGGPGLAEGIMESARWFTMAGAVGACLIVASERS